MKLLLVGIWVVLVALGAAFGAAHFTPTAAGPKPAPAPALQYTKSRVLNVPMIAKGVVQGFMSVQFGYTMDASTLKDMQVPPEAYLVDEAFRTLYADSNIDFKDLTKYDLHGLTSHLVQATNDHLGAPVIKDVLIEQFSYIAKDSVKG